jgi:hypothetical protein
VSSVLVALAGAVLVALSAWGWAGRSRRARWWVGRAFGPQLALGLMPGLGLLVLSVGVLAMGGTSLAPAVALPALLGVVLELAGILDVLPGWWGPRWYRQLPGRRRAAGRTAAFPGHPVGSWRAGWVHDADAGPRRDGASRRGTVHGWLTLYRTGLIFSPHRPEETPGGRSTGVAVPAGDVTGVGVVPPRAGIDGRPRRGRLYRSWFPRLVVRTNDEAYLFEVAWGQAGKVAERLASFSEARR